MNRISRPAALAIAGLTALILLGVGTRLADMAPNFGAIAAISLFAGAVFRRWWLAPIAPLVAMLISDVVIGVYAPAEMLVVYAALLAPALARPFIRGARPGWRRALTIGGCAAGASILFFVSTNLLGVWLIGGWYPRTLEGLAMCFAAALPFFKYTLAGDLFFTFAIFGSWALVRELSASRRLARA